MTALEPAAQVDIGDPAPPPRRGRRGPAAPGPRDTLAGWYRQLWTVGCVLFGLQAVGLMVWSRHLWSRFDLTDDFASFSQAWSLIGSGHLDPYQTTFAYNYPHYGFPFWQSHFEIVMWPLALLHLVWSSPFVLLIVQDLALAGTGLVALRFGLELLQAEWPVEVSGAPLIGIGLLVVLLANPWTYWTASFDFHFQPVGAIFVALCARDVWNGRRRAWWWAAAVLTCGDVAASYLIGLGIGALLAGRATRRRGLALVMIGLVWIAFIIAIGSGKASSLAGNYGYLSNTTGTGLGGTVAALVGIVGHPGAVGHVLRSRWDAIYKFVAGSGTIGVVSAVGFGLALVVIAPNALNVSPNFVGPVAAFQNLVAVVFLIVGAVAVLTFTARRLPFGPVVAAVLGTAALAQALVVSAQWVPQISPALLQVDGATAAQLSRVQSLIPAGAEVIVSQGVMGRFGDRRLVYPFIDAFGGSQTVPVSASTVDFVFVPRQGIEMASPAQTEAAIAQVRTQLQGHQLYRGPDVSAFVWHPPPGTRTVHFEP